MTSIRFALCEKCHLFLTSIRGLRQQENYYQERSQHGTGCYERLEAARANRIKDIETSYPGVYLRYKKTLESLATHRSTDLEVSCGTWICGPPRCGKDYAVRQLGTVYVKPLNKWWDGYDGEENVLISDVEPDHARWLGFF
ncbi:hypothetical protein JTE90_002474 [Oedothorax gibbosus]|uniref:Helicase superfamily 3 single-stranded DNA/RNA virus domain-containing protein n=1 Tax=Oedothorax gibbosus TaxID=931172 RepID=A0AAV6TSR2_9ARAC|nr:hypothetical protein JTE90_002474 [Oedothorax gibbosus]